MKHTKLVVIALAVALAAVLAGCLDFDEQELYAEHDQKADQIILVIQYRGLHATKELEQATTQLAEAVEKKTVALMANWPFAFPIEEMKKDLAEPAEEGDETPPQLRKDFLTLVGRIKVLNGGFYLDPAGRLGASQVVIIEKAKDSIALANRLINAAIVFRYQQEPPDDAYDKMAVELARKGHTWVTLKGHSLIVEAPMPEEILAEGRADFVSGILDDEDLAAELRLLGLRRLLANPVLVWHEDQTLRMKLGLEGRASHYTTKPQGGAYEANLVDHVRETYGIRQDALVARYLVTPDAAAETEAEQAAKLMAPRLSEFDRVRTLVSAIKAKPTGELWAKLTGGAADMKARDAKRDQEQLRHSEEWLQEQMGLSDKDEEAKDAE